MATVSVRYIVNDVDEAISFYCQRLGFEEVMHPAPTFAMLSHGDLRLVLSATGGGPGGGQAMPDGTLPEPGGWNGSALRFLTSAAPLKSCVAVVRGSAMTSSLAWEECRFCSKILLATRSSCSSRSCPKRHCDLRDITTLCRLILREADSGSPVRCRHGVPPRGTVGIGPPPIMRSSDSSRHR